MSKRIEITKEIHSMYQSKDVSGLHELLLKELLTVKELRKSFHESQWCINTITLDKLLLKVADATITGLAKCLAKEMHKNK